MNRYLNVSGKLSGVSAARDFFDGNNIGCVYITGCVESQRVQVAHELAQNSAVHLFITDDERRLSGIAADCSFFGAEAVIYPSKDMIFYSVDMQGRQISAKRLECISKIIAARNAAADRVGCTSTGSVNPTDSVDLQERVLSLSKDTENITIVTTIGALTDFLVPLEKYEERTFHINAGDEIDVEEVKARLVKAGFERKDMVRAPGEWSMRGDIIDIYTVTEENPVRIELWGDVVESVREFDVSSQRSLEKKYGVRVFPASEELFSQDEIEEGLKRIRADYKKRIAEVEKRYKEKPSDGYDICNRLTKEISNLERTGNYGKFFTFFEKEPCCILDYLPEGSFVTVEDVGRVSDALDLIEDEFKHGMEARFSNGYVLKKQRDMIRSRNEIFRMLGFFKLILMSGFNVKLSGFKPDLQTHVETEGISSYNNSFEALVEDVKRFKERGYRTVIAAGTPSRAVRMREELFEYGVEAAVFISASSVNAIHSRVLESDNDVCPELVEGHNATPYKEFITANVLLLPGSVSRGFSYPEIKFALITENDIYTAGHVKRGKKKKKSKTLEELAIASGDFVAHENYGIGIYRGIVKQTVDHVEKDYIKIDYAGNTSVYIPATQTDLLQRYASADTDAPPKIQKIGSAAWVKAKAKAKAGAEAIASDLVRLYATRMSMKGFKFSRDTVWQTEFEDMFPFEETRDQLDAIEDVKRDMESDRCMDRLICGDVGFGKTEVALRAAFKAVQDGKQVAVLAPTTILAGQHFETFTTRLRPFPVNVTLMSGMRTAGENTRAARDVCDGVADIVIGTHRILSKDVTFKNLGLLVVDEEQRFGVSQKEKIKKLKENVDVLALSATPIPRTLNMSLAGIRDMSTLEEPPVDRQPVQTFVSETDDMLIRAAIRRELGRGGQVYYVYNKIHMMEDVYGRLTSLLPDVTFAMAHGQMDKKALERVMTDFINGEIQVLISTTIVETGLDISNVNTIIIENADKLGLSQLYQLRGRVGRSTRVAYAFLLFSRERILTDVAEKRLRAISEMTDLGSGYRLAMKDLEIRGAGNMLGKVQSGHMEAVGFELYTKMLNEAVAKLKGIDIAESFETSVDLAMDAYLPDTYVQRENHKLELYKRIAAIETEDDRQQIEDELTDMYGEPPEPALNLLKLALIKALANKAGFTEVRGGRHEKLWITRLELRMKDDVPVMPDEEAELFASDRGMQLVKKEGSRVMVKIEDGGAYKGVQEYLEGVEELLGAV